MNHIVTRAIIILSFFTLWASLARACKQQKKAEKKAEAPTQKIKKRQSGYISSITIRKNDIELNLRVSKVASTIYILDAVSEWAPETQVTSKPYIEEWNAKFGEKKEYEKLLSNYKKLRARYNIQYYNEENNLQAEVPSPPVIWGVYTPSKSINMLAGKVSSWEEFWDGMELLMNRQDMENFKYTVENLIPPVDSLLENCSAIFDVPRTARDKIEKSLMLYLLGSVKHFYGATDGSKIYINFVPLLGNGEVTHAINRRGYIYAEIPVCRNKPVENIPVDVIFHESCHSIESGITKKDWEQIASNYFSSKKNNLIAGWWILNEALATALGQGIFLSGYDRKEFEAKLKIPYGFYRDILVDSYSKTLLDPLKTGIQKGKKLIEFSSEAAKLFSSFFQSLKIPVSATLKKAVLFTSSNIIDEIRSFLLNNGCAFIWAFHLENPEEGLNFLKKYRALSAIIVAVENNRKTGYKLFQQIEGMKTEIILNEGENKMVIRKERPLSGYIYFISAPSASVAKEAFNQIN